MHNLQAIVLAAGKASRFKTGRSKLLEPICGQPMGLYPIKLLETLHIPTTVVVGYQKEEVTQMITDHMHTPVTFITQQEQLGTGHAVASTKSTWQAHNILVLNGDVPLITPELIQSLYEAHQLTNATISLVTTHYPEASTSYGRVIQKDGKVSIVEPKEFTGSPEEHPWINAGIYLFRKTFLEQYCSTPTQNNAQKEFYLVDLIHTASQLGQHVELLPASYDQVRGVNNFKELWAAETIKRSALISHWMEHGVRFSFAQNVHIDTDVSIGTGTQIGAGVQLRRGTTIGNNVIVGDYSIIEQSIIADNATIFPHSVISESTVEMHAQVGPFAHLRNKTTIGSHSAIGNFVEVKKSIIGSHTKAKHLSYLGDAHIGSNVNIGAGTITCNHNGATKNNTIIHDGAYIGSLNALVAPITIGKSAFTAAGSTITADVPAESLAIARSRQVNKEGYVRKLREKNASKNLVEPNQAASLDPRSFLPPTGFENPEESLGG
jgi:bifunctional UDP-N-acetylglucosamine pyrophosphorylase/glucosamine-1-phosphate N-acetyltransferase